jgi:holliday junction DNA helicase RuvB
MEIDLDIRGESYSEKDKELDIKLRPLQFKDFSGQKQIVENLKIFVKAAKIKRRIIGSCSCCMARQD